MSKYLMNKVKTWNGLKYIIINIETNEVARTDLGQNGLAIFDINDLRDAQKCKTKLESIFA